MKNKGLRIGRQLLLGLIALQILNLSVGSEAYWDNTYDYSYSYNKTYDPTETAVEWIVELKCGQQPEFSYNTHEDSNKGPVKTLHWKKDLQRDLPAPVYIPAQRQVRGEIPDRSVPSPATDPFSPPPEDPVPPSEGPAV